MNTEKYLIINADDLGYCPERNRGILVAFSEGHHISSASVLVNALFSADAVRLSLEKNLPIGLHFNITEGKPISELTKVKTLIDKKTGLFLGKFGLRDAFNESLVSLDEVL
jgi:predicted glycoside hydrolase/deacetylase ChbG (UPF0249 family)